MCKLLLRLCAIWVGNRSLVFKTRVKGGGGVIKLVIKNPWKNYKRNLSQHCTGIPWIAQSLLWLLQAVSLLCGRSRGNSSHWEPRRLSRPPSVSSKNRPKTPSSRARSHGPLTDLGHGGLLSLLAQLSETGEKERLESSEAALEKIKNWCAELC